MALLDLSLVTTALTALVGAHISTSSAWSYAQLPQVTALPPDKLTARSIGMYLYHVTEDAYLKNAAATGPVPVRLVPMSLTLSYQVTALGEGDGEQATLQEQTLIGCAAKALHDHSVIDDDTTVPRPSPLPPLAVLAQAGLDGADNTLRITLAPIAAHEAPVYWSSGTQSTRLSLYYQVSAVLLEPEKPRAVTGRVFAYGVEALAGNAPRLTGSENETVVRVPGLAAQTVLARPAEVPIGGRIAFTGSDLGGDARLVLAQARSDAVEVDASWGVSGHPGADRVTATVGEFVDGSVPIVPGTWTARVRVVHRRRLPDGGTRETPVDSNGTPFTIAARVDALTWVGDTGTLTGYPFRSPDPSVVPEFPPGSVRLAVAGALLDERTDGGAPGPGEFRVVDTRTIGFRLPAGVPTGRPVSVRLFVLGAESPPRWETP